MFTHKLVLLNTNFNASFSYQTCNIQLEETFSSTFLQISIQKSFWKKQSQNCVLKLILILTVVVLQIYLVFSTTCSVPLSISASREDLRSSNAIVGNPCRSGRVYVYDLPPMFNSELLENCESLDGPMDFPMWWRVQRRVRPASDGARWRGWKTWRGWSLKENRPIHWIGGVPLATGFHPRSDIF